MKRARFILIVVGMIGTCIVLWNSSLEPAPPGANHQSSLTPLSDEDLIVAFRSARDNYDRTSLVEMENALEEICRRELLRGLSKDQILALLGEPTSESWVYLDQSVVDS